MKIAAKLNLWGLFGSTVLAYAVACGIAFAPLESFMSHLPNVFKLTCNAVSHVHELPDSFKTLSERMDPTCSECNQP